jgi:hypothetical protein
MKTLIVAAIRCSLLFLVPSATYAISARWDLDPISGDWNTAANWTPMGIPNGPLTQWGAHLYFWGRVGYLLAAALGYGLVRSMVFWNTALAGMVLFLVALLS